MPISDASQKRHAAELVAMRLAAFVLLAAACSLAAAQDVFTQKPVVAPSVAVGESPKPGAAGQEGWAERFGGGPNPLWIWGADKAPRYFLRKSFDGTATAAKVKYTADNHVKLFLNGKEVGQCDEWQDGAEADVTKLLKPEGNELLAEVWNDDGPSGFVLKLALVTDKGQTKYVVSDDTGTSSEKEGEKGE